MRMPISEFHPRAQPPTPDAANERFLSEFKKATLRGDPISVYQALLHCSDNKIAPPQWLADHLLGLIAAYHLGKKPSWKGAGNRPIIVIRRRFENEIKRRAVVAVRAWVNDKSKYQALPTKCIQAWNRQDYRHNEMIRQEDMLNFASVGLRGIKLQRGAPILRCSTRTLRRVMQSKNAYHLPELSGRIASVFGLADPDSYFGTDEPLKPNLK
jgi:hypothetical protein